MKKLLLLSLLTSTYLLASTGSQTKEKFDGTNGWWWYEEEVKNPQTNETEIISYKMTTAERKQLEATKKTNKLLKLLIKEQTETKKLTAIVADRMLYAYPDVAPKYTINKKTGKKCLTNSSMDCFVMPVIAEGQHFPALKEFIRNPTPENSKNWLQVQATYFNHVRKVSQGLRFAYLKDGSEAYPTNTTYSYGDNLFNAQSENVKGVREEKIIKSLKEDIVYLMFLGENQEFEKTNAIFTDIAATNTRYLKDMNKVLVFRSQEQIDNMDKFINDYYVDKMKTVYVKNGWDNIKKIVKPKLFNVQNIRITPTVVIYYKTKEMEKPIYQKISIGSITPNSVREATISFLEYNGIIDPKERAAEKNWSTHDKGHIMKSKFKISKPKKAIDFEKKQKKEVKQND